MKNVIVAWCKTNSEGFESNVPLYFVGKRNLKLGFKNNINILFLDGYKFLSDQYKKSLIDLGFPLFDCSDIFSEFDKKYSQLDRFGDYEKKCFLRWLVIEKFFSGEKIIHYDGDVVFNQDPAAIGKLVENKTFILQGCPAFTVISDQSWFKQYKEQLDLFVKDIDGYSEDAWAKRGGWEVTFKTKWAGSRFRKIIWSDQDFLSHLLHVGQIKQDTVESILLNFSDYILFENPLFIHSYDENFPYKYSRECGIDYLSYARPDAQDCLYKKRVLFWHMQSCFNFYLSKFILRKYMLNLLPLGRIKLALSAKSLEDKLNKKIGKFLHHTSRLSVYKYFFGKTDFGEVFNDCVWWKKGVF